MKVKQLASASGGSSSSPTVEERAKPVKKLSLEWKSAHISHIQSDRVARIWDKAEEILNTPGMVLPAAGNASARQVASLGEGVSSRSVVPPHFVYSKKSGRGPLMEVHCDCAMYRSTPNICHHALAGAEDMNCVEEYVMWVRKTKSSGLNLSTLIAKDIPKSAGKKGSTSRRKGVPKGKKKLVTTTADGIGSPRSECSEPACTLSESVLSNSLLPSTPPFSPMFSLPYSSSPRFPLLDYSNHYASPSFNYNFNSYSPPSNNPSTSNLMPIFRLKFLSGTQIRCCYGCGNPIRSDTKHVPPPPHDIVVSYKERRYYRDAATQELRLTPKEENTYYHFMLSCVHQKHPLFVGSMLEIGEIWPLLQPIHFIHLYEQFGI